MTEAERQKVLERVKRFGCSLKRAPVASKCDREIVLAAVNQDALALEYASEELRQDHEIVLAAVSSNGWALQHALGDCKRDLEIVLAAVNQSAYALNFVAEELLLDSTFATEARGRCYNLKIGLLSGQERKNPGIPPKCTQTLRNKNSKNKNKIEQLLIPA
eukprot:2661476-Amphidinium_carterae.1